MTLGQKQRVFAYVLGKLIARVYVQGYELSWGEAWRPPVTAEFYSERGIGIPGSLHCSRLAVDLNLFKGGKYLTSTKAHEQFGIWWEKQGTMIARKYALARGYKDAAAVQCCWGGRFNDGNHYSIGHGGRK